MRTFTLALAALLSTALAAPAHAQQSKPVAAKAKATPKRTVAPKVVRKTAPKPAPRPWTAIIVRTPEGGYRMGNPNAPLKLVEYGSRTCPTCGNFAKEAMGPLRESYIRTGKLSFEFRDFLVHGAPDFALALLNQCVAAPRFFTVLEAIYANQRAFVDRLTAAEKAQPALLEGYQNASHADAARGFAKVMEAVPFLQRYGLTPAAAQRCLGDDAMIAGIAKTYADGANVHHVRGTPSFFLNGRQLPTYNWSGVEAELLAAGR